MNEAKELEVYQEQMERLSNMTDEDILGLERALRESQAREAKLRAWASHFRYQVVIREADVELWKGLREALKETKP